MNRLAFQDGGDTHQIQIGGVGAGTDADLVDLIHGFYIVRAVGAGGQWDQFGQVNGDLFVIHSIRIRRKLNPILLAALRLQEGPGDFVGWEDGGSGAQLCAHVGDGSTFRYGQTLDTLAGIFDNFSHTALDRENLQNLQDDILRRNPGGKFPCQVYAQHLGHGDVIGTAAHGDCDIQAACTHCQHPDTAAGWRMTVGTDQGLARNSEALQMHLMANTVSWAREPDAVLFGDALDKAVVIGVFKAGLQGIVVDISNAPLCFDTRNAHCLKFEIGHGTGRILCEGLIDFQADLAADCHLAAHNMVFNDLLRQSQSHMIFLHFYFRKFS